MVKHFHQGYIVVGKRCEYNPSTVDSEMFARTLFSLIFANSGPREFKVLAILKAPVFRWLF